MHNRTTRVSVKQYCCTAATNSEEIHECESFHVTRRKRGRGFQYLLTDNEKVTEQTLIKRFKGERDLTSSVDRGRQEATLNVLL